MPLLNNVEIMAEGTWPASETLHISTEDLDGIVASFNFLDLGGKIPLKLGHDGPDARDDPSSQYAMGWVQKIWRDGKKLMAQFDLPTKVYNAIKEKMLKFNSVELLKNVQAGNRQIPWVLDAVALLGTEQPAVGVLREMQASIDARRKGKLLSGSRVCLSQSKRQTKEVKQMDEKEMLALIDKRSGELVSAAVKPLEEKLKLQEAETAKAKEEVRKTKIEMSRAAIDRLFNSAIEAKTLEPKFREQYVKLTKYDKNDDFVLTADLAEVETFIKENSKAQASRATDQGSGKNEDEKGKTVSEIVFARATKKMVAEGHKADDYRARVKCTSALLRDLSKGSEEDKRLVDAYKNSSDTTEDAA